MQVGPLTVTGRLDRVDRNRERLARRDRLQNGRREEPRLARSAARRAAVAAVSDGSEPAAQAIALARVRAGDVGFSALAADPDLLPGRSNPVEGSVRNWSALVDHWSDVLERLAMQFAAGDAAVDPKRLPQTCRYCDLPTLCRINERGGAVTAGARDDDDGTPWVRR